jgi:hypothetical protein
MGQHTHTFPDPTTYSFEDVLVTEHIPCSSEFCDYTQKVQWEVDFTSFKCDGEAVEEEKAKELWNKLCNLINRTITVITERHSSESIEMVSEGNRTFEFKYENTSLTQVKTEIENQEVIFNVSFYRELSPSKR